ncbi:MAG: hypothetical protein P4L50_00135 [Anaerolineaceae bacterium]|nr:hypothetical protein [Anaerolineaceae bacterium]
MSDIIHQTLASGWSIHLSLTNNKAWPYSASVRRMVQMETPSRHRILFGTHAGTTIDDAILSALSEAEHSKPALVDYGATSEPALAIGLDAILKSANLPQEQIIVTRRLA